MNRLSHLNPCPFTCLNPCPYPEALDLLVTISSNVFMGFRVSLYPLLYPFFYPVPLP